MEHCGSTQHQNASLTSYPTKAFCWVTHTSKVYSKISKNVDQTCRDKNACWFEALYCGGVGGRKRVTEWAWTCSGWSGVVGGSCRQALCVFAHTLMAEMTPSLQGPQHACAISEFHTPAPPLLSSALTAAWPGHTKNSTPTHLWPSIVPNQTHIKVTQIKRKL